MGFADGFAKGLQAVQTIQRMQRDRENYEADRKWELDNREITRKQAQATADLTALQTAEAQRRADEARQLAEGRKAVQSAGRVDLVTEQVPGKREGEFELVYRVGDQTFAGRAQADLALKLANSPVQIARRQYQAAASTGIPQLVNEAGANLNTVRGEQRQQMQETLANAWSSGGLGAVVDVFNNQILNGEKWGVTQGADGRVTVAKYVGGKMVGTPSAYDSPQHFLTEQVALHTQDPTKLTDYFVGRLDASQKVAQHAEGVKLQREQLAQADRHHADDDATRRYGISAQSRVGMAQVGVQRDGQNRPTTVITPLVSNGGTQHVAASYDPQTKTFTTANSGVSYPGVPRPQQDPWSGLLGQPAAAAAPPPAPAPARTPVTPSVVRPGAPAPAVPVAPTPAPAPVKTDAQKMQELAQAIKAAKEQR